MVLQVLIADDDPGILVLLENILNSIPQVSIIGKTETAADTIKMANENEIDVALLDIDFPDGKGIELAKKLQSLDPDIDIVFVTAYADYSLEAFNIYSYDYILKPIDENRVIQTVNRLLEEKKLSAEKTFHLLEKFNSIHRLAIKSGTEIEFINMDEILFLERNNKKVTIYCENSILDTYESLNSLENKLNNHFFRSHKSYIINIELIEKISSWNKNIYQIFFKNSSKQAQLSRRKSNALLEQISD